MGVTCFPISVVSLGQRRKTDSAPLVSIPLVNGHGGSADREPSGSGLTSMTRLQRKPVDGSTVVLGHGG